MMKLFRYNWLLLMLATCLLAVSCKEDDSSIPEIKPNDPVNTEDVKKVLNSATTEWGISRDAVIKHMDGYKTVSGTDKDMLQFKPEKGGQSIAYRFADDKLIATAVLLPTTSAELELQSMLNGYAYFAKLSDGEVYENRTANTLATVWNPAEANSSYSAIGFAPIKYANYGMSSSYTGGNGDDNPSGGSTGYKTCPDNKHPHLIDLGLPSGTLWACCNVGASKPEDYGNYYAWGETKTKSIYSWETYKYGTSKDNVIDIGTDIAGTQYDVATANWGAPWCMPSLTQIRELLYNTTYTETSQNGINGFRFTAVNGGVVFFPKAGYRYDDELCTNGRWSNYWSATLNESDRGNAYHLIGVIGGSTWGSSWRCEGKSVRPVH